MMAYVAILEKEAHTDWGVWFPDCPGCTTVATTMQQAVTRAGEALKLWSEGILSDGNGLPPPRSLDELREEPDVAAALGKGDAAVLISLTPDAGQLVRTTVSLDAGLLAAIDQAARLRGLSRSAFLATAAREKMRRSPLAGITE